MGSFLVWTQLPKMGSFSGQKCNFWHENLFFVCKFFYKKVEKKGVIGCRLKKKGGHLV